MSSFLAIKKVFELSASNGTQVLVSRQSRELSAASNDVVTTMKKHFDYIVNVSFDANGGTSCENMTYVLGKTYGQFPSTSRQSFVFDGWHTALTGGTQLSDNSVVELSNTTIYAHWKNADFGSDYTEYIAVATSSYKKTGIYAAARYSTASVITVDWGDGSLEEVDGSISQLAHEYASAGTYHVKVSNNISSFAPSYNNSTWHSTTSQNRYTFKDMVKTGSRLSSTAAMPNQAFFYCAALSSINFLSSCYTGLTSIPANAFQYCTGLKTLSSLPARIKILGSSAFRYCSGLSGIQDLRSTGLTSFYNTYLFANCTGVKEFKLPNNIGAYTGNYLFQQDTGLSAFTIPSSLTAISQYAMYGCTALKNITIPSNIKTINNYAFRECSSLSSVTYETTALTSIGTNAFYYCYALRDLNIPNTVKSIGVYAFYYCYNTAASSLTLPSALTSLGTNAYQYCYSLKELTIPSGLTAIGNTAFSGCRALSSITDYRLTAQTVGANTFGSATGAGNTTYTGYNTRGSNVLWVPDGATGYDSSYWLDPLQNASKCGFNLSVIGGGGGGGSAETTISYYDGTTSSYSITGEFGGMNLTNAGIWDEPYSWAKQPVSASIGSDVTSIGSQAFQNCTSLTSVTIPDSVLSIGDNAFEGCAELTNVVMPSNDVYVGDMGFYGCDGLADANGFVIIQNRLYGYYGISDSITIPSNVTEIREEAFTGNMGITTVIIPDSVTYIGRATFAACDNLTSVVLGNSVMIIGYAAFGSCQSLIAITIPNSVTSIEAYAFYGCGGLTNVTISDGVTSIEECAFQDCTSLTCVTIYEYNGYSDNIKDMMIMAGADSSDIVWNVVNS